MSTVTLVEDSLMAGIAALMLFIGSHGNTTLGFVILDAVQLIPID